MISEERARELLQLPFDSDVDRLRYWLQVQQGLDPQPQVPGGITREEVDEVLVSDDSGSLWGKIRLGRYEYGALVVIHFTDGPNEHGYLSSVPGEEGTVDEAGIVHVPHTHGEKCDAGPQWLSLVELIINPLVVSINEVTTQRGGQHLWA